MPKRHSKAYTPTNGVRTDFKRLMNIFLSSATVRFEQFSEVWRALNMSYLCAGRNTDREAREFIEKVLVIAREYFLPPYQFQVRVGGLYLMYAVYQIQPISPKAKIRLTSQHWDDALQFQQQAKLQSHLDVVYIFNRLIQEQAFHFCFTPQETGVQSSAWESEDAEVDLADEMKEEKCIINKLFNYESLEQLSYLQDQYQRMKVALAGPHATKPDKSLNVVKEELVEDIVLSLQSFKENVANMAKRVGNSKQKAAKELKTVPETVGSRRQALKNQAYTGSPSTRRQSLGSPTASPEKNLAIDRANRAALRALAKSKADGDKTNDTDLDISEASNASPTKSPAEDCPAISVSKKDLSMPLIGTDDEELSSGDGSDDDYEPASKRAKGRKLCRQKIASRKNLQLNKTKSSSTSRAGFGKAPSRESVSSTKHQPKQSAKTRSLSANVQSDVEPSSSKEKDANGCVTKASLSDKSGPEKSGFRITWDPVVKLLARDDGAATGAKRRRGRPSKYLQDFLDKKKALDTEIATHRKSNVDESGESEVFQPFLSHKQKVQSEQVGVSNGENPSKRELNSSSNMEPTSKSVSRELGDNTSSAESMQGLPNTRQKSGAMGLKSGLKDKPKTRSTYEVVMAPTVRRYTSNIFYNAESTKGGSSLQPAPCGIVQGRDQLTCFDPQETARNEDVSNRERRLCSQSEETSTPVLGKEQREQNVQMSKHLNDVKKDGAKAQSSYTIVLAPTASQGYADMGGNASALPLQLKFPKAQFSHSMQGKMIKFSGQQKPSLFSKSFATTSNNSESAQSCHRELDASMSKSSPNSLDIDTKPSTSQVQNQENMTSNDQHECDFNTKSACSSAKERVKKSQLSDSQEDSVDLKQDVPPQMRKIKKPRKSKYYSVPSGFGEETAQKPPTKTILYQENLVKVFNKIAGPKKEPPIKSESPALKAMREFREKLAASTKAEPQKPEKSPKVVLDSVKFI